MTDIDIENELNKIQNALTAFKTLLDNMQANDPALTILKSQAEAGLIGVKKLKEFSGVE